MMNATCPYEKAFEGDDTGKSLYICISAFSGSISMIGSSLILYMISRGGWTTLSRTRNRLLFGGSVIDLFSSVALGVSIIPTPQETGCSVGMGNLSTCAAQGFFIQLSFASPAYNTMLSLYFLLTIRYGMNQATIAKRYELLMHAYAIVPALSTAIIGVTNDMFFSESAFCWIGDVCQSNGNCPNGNIWGKGYGVGIASICFIGICTITTVICMLSISCTLRKRNLVMLQYNFRRERNSRSGNSQLNDVEFAAVEFAKQAYFYATAYSLTYALVFCDLAASNISSSAIALPSWVHFHLVAVFFPLQGMLNFFAHVRPIVSKIQRDDNDGEVCYITALRMVIVGTVEETISSIDMSVIEDSSAIEYLTDSQDSPVARRSSIFRLPTHYRA